MKSRFENFRSLLVVLVTFAAIPFARGDETSLRIRVTTPKGARVQNAYVALTAPDRPARRPSFETIATNGEGRFQVISGDYQVFVEASGYAPHVRMVHAVRGRRNDVSVELMPLLMITGTVQELDGRPLPGARVSQIRAAIPAAIGLVSAVAQGHLGRGWMATSDESGLWTLAVASDRSTPLLIEASGFAPAMRWSRPATEAREIPVKLRPGSGLTVLTDRIAPDTLLIPTRTSRRDEADVAAEWEEHIWARPAVTEKVEWSGLPAGEYEIRAQYPNPLRFAAPIDLGRVTLVAGRSAELRVKLPPPPPIARQYTSVFVPAPTDLMDLQAVARVASGSVEQVRHSVEKCVGGTNIYLDTSADAHQMYVTTAKSLLLPKTEDAATPDGTRPLETLQFAKGGGKLRLSVRGESYSLPRSGRAEFRECPNDQMASLPFGVSSDGFVSLPVPAPCRALTLRFEEFETVGMRVTVAAGETHWLGDHELEVAATAEVRVLREPALSVVPKARIRVLIEPPAGLPLVVAEVVADEDGKAVLKGLPAAQELIFEAREPASELSGTTRIRIEPGQHATIDPLLIPEAASLVVAPKLDEQFTSIYPDAKIVAISIERNAAGGAPSRRMINIDREDGEARFGDLQPGTWHLLAVVMASAAAQPIELEPVELKAAEVRRLEPRIRPAVFQGQVVAGDEDAEASVGIGDPPGPRAITRRIRTSSSGRFQAVLPRPGIYDVEIVRVSNPQQPIALGEVPFLDPNQIVQITIPEGGISARVRSGETPFAGAVVTATMRSNRSGGGVRQNLRRATTDAQGEARVEGLLEGTWIVDARDAESGRTAEKVVTVDRERLSDVELQLTKAAALGGVVRDSGGRLAGGATIKCLFVGTGALPRFAEGQSAGGGTFKIELPSPPPDLLRCGITTPTGAVGAFTTPPTNDAQFQLPAASARLVVADFRANPGRDLFWLVSPDGRIVSLSWIAAAIQPHATHLSIPSLPSGVWKVVRTDTIDKWITLARGLGNSLSAVSEVRLQPGEEQTIRLNP